MSAPSTAHSTPSAPPAAKSVTTTSSSASFFNSSLGLKVVMALTGILLIGFVLVHLLGNLQMFVGRDKMNEYAEFLHKLGPLLWVARIGLIAIFVLHIVSAFRLRARNQAARPTPYVAQRTVQASAASLTMAETGFIILVFVLLHLAHYTFTVLPGTVLGMDPEGRRDVYGMVVNGFQNPAYSTIYIFCMVVLGIHLSHGISSFFQSLGLNHPKYTPVVRKVAPAIAWAFAIGYLSIPIGVLVGIVK